MRRHIYELGGPRKSPHGQSGLSCNNRGSNTVNKPSFWRYIGQQWRWLALGSSTGIVMNTSVVLPPILLGRIIDHASSYISGGGAVGLNIISRDIMLYLLAVLVYAVGRLGKRYGLRIMANRMNCCLRADLLAAAFAWPMPRYDQEKVGDIMSRAVGDVQSFSDAVQVVVTEVFDTALMMISSFVAILVINPRLTLIASLPVPVAVGIAQWMGPRIFARATKVREVASAMNSHLQQSVSGIRVFRLLGRESEQGQHFAQLSDRQRRANINLALLQGGVMPVYSIVASLGVVLIIGWGGLDVLHGQWTLGVFTSYLTMFVAMAARTLMAAQTINRAHVGAAAWRRIAPKLTVQAEDEVVEPETAVPAAQGLDIQASGLSFSFPGSVRPVLTDLNFVIPAGAWIGVTGPIGSGKTALALALSGLYPYQGSLTIGGKELAHFSRTEKVATIAHMGQDSFLFSASIAENVAFRPLAEVDAAKLDQVAHWSALRDDLPLFEQGYQTAVGEVGVRVSGGQRQRVALSRALYPHTPLLILDDPFSAVDLATERHMIERLREAFAGSTVIMFSHRLASFVHTDQVWVLNQGVFAEQGTHQELLQQNGIYAKIYHAQQWMEANAE